MKTKTQLEKEIEEHKNFHLQKECTCDNIFGFCRASIELKATLTQTNKIIEMIGKEIGFYKMLLLNHKNMMQKRWNFKTIEETEDYLETNKDYLYIMYNSKIQVCEELLTKIKGEDLE